MYSPRVQKKDLKEGKMGKELSIRTNIKEEEDSTDLILEYLKESKMVKE
jgi:hypothetical protein